MQKLKDWFDRNLVFIAQMVVVLIIFWVYERSHQARHNKVEAQVEKLTEWAMDQ